AGAGATSIATRGAAARNAGAARSSSGHNAAACASSTAPISATKRSARAAAPAALTIRSMKLATYKDGSRDGQLVVVSRGLASAHYATGISTRLQQVLDDWNFISPQLQDLYATLNGGKARHAFAFDPALCMAPLPRACQWADGSAYLNHVELVRRARNAEV